MEWTVNGFREHDGKGMPVDGKTIVSVKHQSGAETGCFPASDFYGEGEGMGGDWWTHQDEWFDIVAYKVEEENENPS